MIQTKLNTYSTIDSLFLETDSQLRQCPCPSCNTHISKWVMKDGKHRLFQCPKCGTRILTEPTLKITKILEGESYDN